MAAAAVSGCAQIPADTPSIGKQRDFAPQTVAKRLASHWSVAPPIREITIKHPAFLKKPGAFPKVFEDRQVDVFIHGTLTDFVAALSEAGIPVLLDVEAEAAKRRIMIGRYRGPLGPLLRSVAKRTGLVVSYDGDENRGLLVFSAAGEYLVSLVQDEDFLKQVAGGLTQIGCQDVMVSATTGMVRCLVSSAHYDAIDRYLRHAIDNAATVTLQVAVVTVSLDDSLNEGLDWDSIAIAYKGGVSDSQTTPLGVGGAAGAGNGSGSDSNGTQNPGDSVSQAVENGIRAALSGTTFGIAYQTADFSLKAFLNSLAKYGSSRTEQNLILKTLTGSEVKIRSGNTVPYVSGVSLASTNVNNNLGVGNTLAGVQTSTVNTGITVTIKPFYDALSNTITMDVEIDMKNLLGFIDLSAGNQIGSVSQPNTQDQAFNDVARIAAGETVVLGGIVYETTNENLSNLALLRRLPTASRKRTRKREAMFIVIRPTVTVYRFMASEAESR